MEVMLEVMEVVLEVMDVGMEVVKLEARWWPSWTVRTF